MGNTTTTKDVEKIYNSIIHSSYVVGNGVRNYGNIEKRTEETVDIVTDYPWSIDKVMKSKDGGIINVPHCYAIEYQQRYTSSITNLINSSNALTGGIDNTVNTVSKLYNNVSNLIQNLSGIDSNKSNEANKSAQGGILTSLGENLSAFWDKSKNRLEKISEKINGPIQSTHSGYMQPYRLLYDLIPTGQRYCMPMISEPPIIQTHNSFSDSTDDFSSLSANTFFSKISNWASGIVSLNRDMSIVSDLISSETGNKNSSSNQVWERMHVEKAKFFQYPTDTETYTVQFPLINTVRLEGTPAWKRNYKFIMLFCMRNMVFRKDNASYYPPLFYDLIIPGTIRQPYTYVESVNVQPLGVVRMLNGEGLLPSTFTDQTNKLSIPVPEAWVVTIKFKSLLATSANLVLSGLNDLPIVTSK